MSGPRFKVICTSYKAARWLPRCLKSIAGQTYPDFDVAVADDASPSGVEASYIREFCKQADAFDDGRRWVSICRRTNVDVIASQHECIEAICEDDDDVIVIVDGDDFLMRPDSLAVLASHYEPWVQMTYGSYRPYPDSPTCPPAIPYPDEVIQNRDFRKFIKSGGKVSFNHLRTYRYGTYRQIPVDRYFKRSRRWIRNDVDLAVMLPCLEIAGPNHKVLTDELLGYNSVNPLSYWRIKPKQIAVDGRYILSLPKLEPQC